MSISELRLNMNANKYDNFVIELNDLCKKHNVNICASGYEHIEVWNGFKEVSHIEYAEDEPSRVEW